MKIVAFDSGTLVALFSLEAYTPLRFVGQRALLELIGNVYKFAGRPALTATVDELQQKGFEFLNGELELNGETVPVRRLSIHNDGIVLVASTTDDADRIFDHLQTWLKTEGAFRDVPVSRLYLSELVVDFEHSPAKLMKHYEALECLATKHMSADNRPFKKAGFSHFSIEFVAEAGFCPRFSIERRTGSSLEQERYYCAAPLRTEHHIEALEDIEKLAAQS
ncbi:MAG: hypothetical protein ACK4M6_04445 [Hyphomonas sp.]